MENLVLGCKCNNKKDLKKCLRLLQKHNITWTYNQKINLDADIRRYFIKDSIIICLRKSLFQIKKFEISYTLKPFVYGYNKFSDNYYFIVNLDTFAKYLQYYEKWKLLH